MGLIHFYGDSTLRIVSSVFPEHNWLFWKFRRSPKNMLEKLSQDPVKEKEMLVNIMKELNIQKESDWFNVTSFQLRNVLNSRLSYVKSLVNMLIFSVESN